MAAKWMRLTASMVVMLSSLSSAQKFPYVPTQILTAGNCLEPSTPCDGSDIAYIFSQTDSGVSFRQLNFSGTLNLDLSLDRLTDNLPFLEDQPDTTAFGATRTGNGTLLVYAGDCDGGIGSVWSYTQGGEWEKRTTGDNGERPRGPYFLGGTLAYSATLAPTMDQPTIYTYGGMCSSPSSDSEDWQSDANYTKSMLSVEPETQATDALYTLSVASNSGPRTPIAGFTLTELTPSMTNKSGTVTQQASYVLLGGHSQKAFINMSTAAVWNLPAESWTYVNIQAPDVQGNTELALTTRATTFDNVYSRSGHTAVLSEDGASIIVLGGWVGDVNTPAEPQLAILEMSQAYSGWQWKIPARQPTNNGIYGHGAAMLPGNVMMVYGGWETAPISAKVKRQITKRQSTSNTTPRFFNVTSGSWSNSYTNPSAERPAEEQPDAPGKSDGPSSKTLGLGLGLGFGLAVLLVAALILFYWYRKNKKEREERDQAVRDLAQDANCFLPDDEMIERDDPWGPGGWYNNGQDRYQNGERSLGYETLRGSRGGGNTGPLPGLHIPRKPVTQGRQQRAGYAPATQRPGNLGGPGHIHPIYEDDEEESFHHNYHNEAMTPTSDAPSDPFQTPTAATAAAAGAFPPAGRASATPSPEGRRHDPEVQDWVSDVDAADALLARMGSRQGRGSPTRRGSYRSALRDDESRSGSNLSESARSVTESLKARKPNPLVPLALFSGSKDVEHQKPGSSSSSSFQTARSSFGALQAEGPSLLLGRNVAPSPNYDDDDLPPSPSKSKPRRGWLGSLRRVFSTSENTTPQSSREDIGHHDADFQTGTEYEPGLVGLRGELLRRKQGRQDWEGGDAPPGEPSDWDIEKAVEQRLVQVMFTVPRERLRVVNADDELSGDDEREALVEPQSAVLVDPEKESQRSTEGGSPRGKEVIGEHSRVEERRVEHESPLEEKFDEKRPLQEVENVFDDKHQQEEDVFSDKRHPDDVFVDEKRYPDDVLLDEKPYPQVANVFNKTRHPDDVFVDEKPYPDDVLMGQKRYPEDVLMDQKRYSDDVLRGPNRYPDESLVFEGHALEQIDERSEPDQTPQKKPRPRPIHLPPPTHARNNSHDTSFLDSLEPHFSNETDDTGRRSSGAGVVLEAQAMPLTRERPRTRVLQMVDSFESMSREGSREGSPVRGGGV